jgi:hypothetical protein
MNARADERARLSGAILSAIERRRRETGTTLIDLCVDVDRATYSRWRSGDHDPRVGQLAQVIRKLGGRLVVVWDK